MHPDDVDRARAAWQSAIRASTPYQVEYRVRAAGGDYRWMVARALPVSGPEGQVIGWAGTWTDVDDLRRLQDALGGANAVPAASLAILEALQATIPLGIGFVDRRLRVVHMNELLAGLNGLSPEEAKGRSLAEVMGPIGPGRAFLPLAAAIPVAWETGEAESWSLSMHDRSVVMENMAEGLYTLDADGLVTYLNAAASKMLGWAPDELLGKPMHETVHFQHEDGTPVPASRIPAAEGPHRSDRPIRVTTDAFTRKDGSIFPVSYSSAPLRSATTIQGVVVVFRDITEERDELGRVQRDLAALSWLGRIRDALDEDRMVLYSQPIVPVSGGLPSEELLLRMISRTGEIILPGAFFPWPRSTA